MELHMKGRGKTQTCAKAPTSAIKARDTMQCCPLQTSQLPCSFPTPALVQGSAQWRFFCSPLSKAVCDRGTSHQRGGS